jgi:arsenate reductase-like glutaredoxin family protein
MTCKNAQEFLESLGAQVKTKVDARREPRSPAEALALAKKAETIHAARGKNVTTFKMKDKPDEELLLQHLIGRSGTLRAPAAVIGKTLVVGFNEELFREVLGV